MFQHCHGGVGDDFTFKGVDFFATILCKGCRLTIMINNKLKIGCLTYRPKSKIM